MPTPWVKLHVEIIDDPKLMHFTDGEWRFLVSMIALARNGVPPGVVNFDADQLAYRLRKTREWVDAGLRACIDSGILDARPEGLVLLAWRVRQEQRKPEPKEVVAGRMRRYRERRLAVLDGESGDGP